MRLTVAGRRRPLTLHGSEYAIQAGQLVRLIERRRTEPQHRLDPTHLVSGG